MLITDMTNNEIIMTCYIEQEPIHFTLQWLYLTGQTEKVFIDLHPFGDPDKLSDVMIDYEIDHMGRHFDSEHSAADISVSYMYAEMITKG